VGVFCGGVGVVRSDVLCGVGVATCVAGDECAKSAVWQMQFC